LDTHLTENQIRAAIEADDPVAVELMWDLYAGDLMALLQGLLGSSHDAEDTLQQVFFKLVRLRQRLARTRNLKAYIFRIARNEAWDLIKKRNRQRLRPDIKDVWLTAKTDRDEAMAEQLTNALMALPPEQRAVIVLKIHRDQTFRQIAKLMGLSQNTAASRYRYGIHRLRTLLQGLFK
jgi:RNA polymerase sigma-70 factor (ECF subfamily)